MLDIKVLNERYQRSVLLAMIKKAVEMGSKIGVAYVCVRDLGEPGYSIITAEVEEGGSGQRKCLSKAMGDFSDLMNEARDNRDLTGTAINIDSGVVTSHGGKIVIVGFYSGNENDLEITAIGFDMLLETRG